MAAGAKVLFTFAFLLVLILSYGLIFSEGRQLSKNSGGGSRGGGGGGFVSSSEESVPYGPGHSPGVGHSVGPARADP